jgi:hypothetical protein
MRSFAGAFQAHWVALRKKETSHCSGPSHPPSARVSHNAGARPGRKEAAPEPAHPVRGHPAPPLWPSGLRIGMTIERARLPAVPAPAQAVPAPRCRAAAPRGAPPKQAPAPALEMTGAFENNIFPSLLLSFGAAYPEYSRGLTVALRNLPAAGATPAADRLRLSSSAPSRSASTRLRQAPRPSTRSLPWNFDALRRTTQMQPQSFVATLLVDGRPAGRGDPRLHAAFGQRGGLPHLQRLHGPVARHQRVLRRLRQRGPPVDQRPPPGGGRRRDRPRLHRLPGRPPGRHAAGPGDLGRPRRPGPELRERRDRQQHVPPGLHPVRALPRPVGPRPRRKLRRRLGSLFASILRRIGLRPVLLFRPGHCFTGFYDAAGGRPPRGLRDHVPRRGPLLRGGGRGREGAPDHAPLPGDAAVLDRRHRRLQGARASPPFPTTRPTASDRAGQLSSSSDPEAASRRRRARGRGRWRPRRAPNPRSPG